MIERFARAAAKYIALCVAWIAAAAALWIVSASWIWHVLTDEPFTFPFDQWLGATQWWMANWWCNVSLVVSAAFATVMLAADAVATFFLMRSTGRMKKRLTPKSDGKPLPIEDGVTDNHGHARWLTIEEMKKLYSGPASPEWGCLVIGEARRVDLEDVANVPFSPRDEATWGQGGKADLLTDPCEEGSTHELLFGGSGVGKTMKLATSQVTWRGSLICFDPSVELGPMLIEHRENIGQRVITIGYAMGASSRDDEVARLINDRRVPINALACVRPRTEGAGARVLSMTASICGEEQERGNNAVFESAGRNLIACLMAHLLWSNTTPPEMKTVSSLVEAICIPELEMKEFLKGVHRTSDSSLARRLAGSLMETHHETFSGAYFNATQLSGWMMEDENTELLSGTFDPAEILKGDLSAYIEIPSDTLLNTPGVGRVIVDSFVSSIMQARGNFAQRMLLDVEEAKLVGNMKSMENNLRMGRKYGLTMRLAYTSPSDMEDVWGEKKMQAWMDGVSFTSYAAVASPKTQRELSESFGTRAVMAYSEGENTGTNRQFSQVLPNSSLGANVNKHEQSRRLILPDEFRDARSDELFVVPRSGRPFRCGVDLCYRRPEIMAQIKPTPYLNRRQKAGDLVV